MTTVRGYIERIVYRNADNGYTVVETGYEGETAVLVGTFPYIEEGSFIEAQGEMKEHPVYGEQLSVYKYEIKEPEDARAMERYLASGAVKGIGDALAARIVRFFGSDTFRILEEEPERLAEVKGISMRMAMSIGAQAEEKKDMRDAMLFLSKYGIGMNLALKIYRLYGTDIYNIIRNNPYRIADDIPGIGFKTADDIAVRAGIPADSEYRIKCGILYALSQASAQGHMYLPAEELEREAAEVLGELPGGWRDYLTELQFDKKIMVRSVDGEDAIYPAYAYYTELNTARLLLDRNIRSAKAFRQSVLEIDELMDDDDLVPDERQREAVIKAASSGLLIITGGPGTGKTTTIKAIIRYFERKGMKISLAAPTGRAAKRMTEAVGREARTIHRLLEVNGAPADDHNEYTAVGFERNEEHPLDADVIIIDEMSMVDIYLMNALLKAVTIGTRLVLVGDTDQLPSVGPGNVLRDMIDSGCFDVVRLTNIYRQDEDSDIILNAHRMIEGEPIDLSKPSRDFLFIKRETADAAISAAITLLTDKLPAYVHADVSELQILTPMRKGALGVERLNMIFRERLNPAAPGKAEKELFGTLFREGDKVMQIKNDYRMHWEVRGPMGYALKEGEGIYNGDTGVIREINIYAQTLEVEYDEGRIATYDFTQADELELAYAVTVHKSQGSEYPAVIIPVLGGPKMLMTRNIIYTAVTRARKCVAMVGLPEYFYKMTANTLEARRYSGLKDRLTELA